MEFSWTDATWNAWKRRDIIVHANATISVNVCDPDPMEVLALHVKGFNEQILKQEVATDVTITSVNGAKVKCHKSFLTVRSPVFKAMFESDMEEKITSNVEMVEMTEVGVRAFLAYLYYMDTKDAQKNCEVALELLEASHKYDIEEMEKTLKGIIINKDNVWFTVDMVLKLFLFARNLEGGADLKTKAVRVLKNM